MYLTPICSFIQSRTTATGWIDVRNALGHLCDLGHDHLKTHPSISAEGESGQGLLGHLAVQINRWIASIFLST